MTKMIENKEFTCPKCGSHKFGSALVSGTVQNGTWEGCCHGVVQRTPGVATNCGFTWSRTDDGKYFKGTGHFYPGENIGQVILRKS
jgi:hypothetical protein